MRIFPSCIYPSLRWSCVSLYNSIAREHTVQANIIWVTQPNGEGTGPVTASDLLMLPIPQIMHPGAVTAENLDPQRSETSYPMADSLLNVAAQNCDGSSNGSMDLLVKPL